MKFRWRRASPIALTVVLALRAFAQSSSVLFDQAVARLDAGKPAEGFALFSQIARREPNELGTRAYLVKAAVAMDNTAAARANLELLRRLAASDSGLHAQLAEWCAPGRNVELGVDQVRYALKLEQLAPQKARLYYLRGSLAVRQGAEELAKDDLGRAMALDPGTPLYVVALATLQGTARPKLIRPGPPAQWPPTLPASDRPVGAVCPARTRFGRQLRGADLGRAAHDGGPRLCCFPRCYRPH